MRVSMCAHGYKDFTDKMAIFRRKLSIKRLLTLSMSQNNCLSILPLCSYPHYLHPEVMTFGIHPVSGRRPNLRGSAFTCLCCSLNSASQSIYLHPQQGKQARNESRASSTGQKTATTTECKVFCVVW